MFECLINFYFDDGRILKVENLENLLELAILELSYKYSSNYSICLKGVTISQTQRCLRTTETFLNITHNHN